MTCNLVSHWGKPRAKSKAVWPFAVFTAGSAWAASSKRIMPWSPHLDAAWIGYNFSGQFDLSFTPAKPCWCRKRWSRSCLRCFRWSLWDGLEIRKPESESEVSSDLVALIDSSLESALEELVFPVALTKLVFPQVTSLTLQAGLGASASVKRSPISISMESAATQSSRINMGGWSVAVSCMFPIFIAAKVDSGTGQTFKQVLELMSVNEFCGNRWTSWTDIGKKTKSLKWLSLRPPCLPKTVLPHKHGAPRCCFGFKLHCLHECGCLSTKYLSSRLISIIGVCFKCLAPATHSAAKRAKACVQAAPGQICCSVA